MALTETLRDTFNDNVVDTTKWPNNYNTAGAVPTEVGGRARVVCDTGFSAYASDTAYTLQDSHAWVRMFPPAAGGAATEAWAQLLITSSTSGTDAIFEVNAVTGMLTMAVRVGFVDAGAVSIAYDSTNHAWLRIREDTGTLFWDTSADGLAWTNRRSTASPAWVSDIDIEMQLIAHRDSGTPDFAEFDSFNVIPSTAVFADLTDNFNDNIVNTTLWPDNYNTGPGGQPIEAGGLAQVPCDTGFAAYASSPIYRLEDSYAFVQAFPPSGTGMNEAYSQLLILSDVPGTQIVFQIDAATNLLLMTVHVAFIDEGGASLPYDPVEHAWLRILEDAGTLQWDTSADGREWTTRHTDASPTWVSENDLQVQLLAHCSPLVTGGGPTGEFADFDNFNVRPVLADGYTVGIDWNGDGDYGDANENVTEDVLASGVVNFQYGRDQARALSPPRVGALGFSLCNADGVFSPENPDSPISQDISPAAPIKIEEVINDTLYPLKTGRIDTFKVDTNRGRLSADITGLDGLALLRGTKISTGLFQAQRTGALIGVILDEIGWTAARDLDLGATFVPWWWANQADAFDLLTELIRSEGQPSIAYIAPDGTFTYRDRHHRLQDTASLTSQAVFASMGRDCDSPPVTGFSFLDDFGYEHGWRDIVNSITFPVDERRPAANLTVVWESDTAISLSLGESTTVKVQANDPFRDAQDLVDGTDIVYTGTGVPVVLLSRTSGQSVTISISAAGGTVNVSHLQLRARSVPVARTVEVTATDSTSITRHGERTYGQDAPWVNQHDAFAVAVLLLAAYAERRPTVELRIVSSDLAHHLQVVERQISDLITIRNGVLGLDADFHIETIGHTLARMVGEDTCPGPVHYATFGCERSGVVVPDNPFTFDKAGAGFDDGVFDPTGFDDPDTVFIFDHATQGQFGTGQFGT